MKLKRIISILLLLFLLTGCESSTSLSKSTPIPSPEPEKAIIHGQLLSASKTPQNDIIVRLAEVYRGENESGAFVLDEAQSPSTISNEDGKFYFLNIQPGEYVLFVGTLHLNYKVVAESDQTPIVYVVGPGETLEIEPIIVEFD